MTDHDRGPGAGFQTESFEFVLHTKSGRFFWNLTGRPKTVLFIGILLFALAAAFLPKLRKDTSAEAFIGADDPAVVYRKHIEDVFALTDPVIVAVVNDGATGVFNPETLTIVGQITNTLRDMDGVLANRVTSVASQNNVVGDENGLIVEPFYVDTVESQEQADAIRKAVLDIPLFAGSIVSRDGTVALIAAELVDQSKGFAVFQAVNKFADTLPAGNIRIYVAGEGAVAEFLGHYVDDDARRLYPIIALVIMSILFVAYRTARGIGLPMMVVLGAVPITLGVMAACDVPYYIITSALPAILIATGVADGIHIVGEYYEELALRPHSRQRDLVVRTMSELWMPIFFTSLTDAIGFLSLAASPSMPPMRAFGVFAALGVVVAWSFSTFMLPAALTLLKPKLSPRFKSQRKTMEDVRADRFARLVAAIGEGVIRYPRIPLGFAAGLMIAGVAGTMLLTIDYSRIDYFHEEEEIRQADRLINSRMNGSNFLDILVEAPEPEGLYNPEYLRTMEKLQGYLLAQPHVKSAVSIVDYLKQINRALNENKPEFYVLPDNENLAAQLLLLYSASGADLEEQIDQEYRLANIRVSMDSGLYSDIKSVVETAQQYIDTTIPGTGLTVTISGRSNVTYHWVEGLAWGHFVGVILSLIATALATMVSFRSFWAGIYGLVPVTLSVLSIYAAMGLFGIWLSVGTSMFASIAIGISVNFALHTLQRVLELVREYGDNLEYALRIMFPTTGRSLFFNFISVFLGFAVLMTSQVPPLNTFGILVAVAVAISFISSLTVLPAMLLVFKPKFLHHRGTKIDIETAEMKIEDW